MSRLSLLEAAAAVLEYLPWQYIRSDPIDQPNQVRALKDFECSLARGKESVRHKQAHGAENFTHSLATDNLHEVHVCTNQFVY